jgi:hypothetical protein
MSLKRRKALEKHTPEEEEEGEGKERQLEE